MPDRCFYYTDGRVTVRDVFEDRDVVFVQEDIAGPPVIVRAGSEIIGNRRHRIRAFQRVVVALAAHQKRWVEDRITMYVERI